MRGIASFLFCLGILFLAPVGTVLAEDPEAGVSAESEYWVTSSSGVYGDLKIEEAPSVGASNRVEEGRVVVDMSLSPAGTTMEQGFELNVLAADPSQFSVPGRGYVGVAIDKLSERGAVSIDVKRGDGTVYSVFYTRKPGLLPCTLLTPWFNVDDKITVKVGLSHLSGMRIFVRKYQHP